MVKISVCEVEVQGTTFDLMAYDDFGRQEITLSSGKVNVHTVSNEQVIKLGQVLVFKDDHIQVGK